MVCLRCIVVVKDEIERLGMEYEEVRLGEAMIKDPVTAAQIKALDEALKKSGLGVLDDKKSILLEKIKTLVIEQIHYSDEPLLENFSTFLARHTLHDYTYLSNLFAATQGTTLEKYIILNKIEKVKELLIYEQMTLSEIAARMNYSSAAYLSRQFKHVTGYTAHEFKKIKSQ